MSKAQTSIDFRSDMHVVAYGAGVNTVGMLCGLRERNEIPHAIKFSDTRGEKPETYEHIALMNDVLKGWGFPPIDFLCRADFPNSKTGDESLEAECLRLGTLPSRAYGFGTCADKWKIDPFKWWAKTDDRARLALKSGGTVVRYIGYDAGEHHRISDHQDKGLSKRFPLIEWDWDRDGCITACKRHRIPIPPKSACFYCPSSTREEVIQLGQRHPALAGRAVALERRALDTGRWNIAGLGRRFAWGDLLTSDSPDAFPEACVESCTICEVG